jgi:hypothetical protein
MTQSGHDLDQRAAPQNALLDVLQYVFKLGAKINRHEL